MKLRNILVNFSFLIIFASAGAKAQLLDNLVDAVGGFAPTHSAAGCGLGTTLFSGSVGKRYLISAASTNDTTNLLGAGIPGSASMYSGTSKCGRITPTTQVNPLMRASRKQEWFIAGNFEFLSVQMSQGKGEFLAAYGEMLGCSQTQMTRFQATAMENYEKIFTPTHTPADVLSSTKSILKTDSELAAACTAI